MILYTAMIDPEPLPGRLASIVTLSRLDRHDRERHLMQVADLTEMEIYGIQTGLVIAVIGRGKAASLNNARRRLKRLGTTADAFGISVRQLLECEA